MGRQPATRSSPFISSLARLEAQREIRWLRRGVYTLALVVVIQWIALAFLLWQ